MDGDWLSELDKIQVKAWIFNPSLKKLKVKNHAYNEGFDNQSYHSTEFLNVMLHETVKCLPPENKQQSCIRCLFFLAQTTVLHLINRSNR